MLYRSSEGNEIGWMSGRYDTLSYLGTLGLGI